MVGVNGDFFTLATGKPSRRPDAGRTLVESPPNADRSSAGITTDGALDIRRVEFFGTWRGLGRRRGR